MAYWFSVCKTTREADVSPPPLACCANSVYHGKFIKLPRRHIVHEWLCGGFTSASPPAQHCGNAEPWGRKL